MTQQSVRNCYKWVTKFNSQLCEAFVGQWSLPKESLQHWLPRTIKVFKHSMISWEEQCIQLLPAEWACGERNSKLHLGTLVPSCAALQFLGLNLSDLLHSDNCCPEVRPKKKKRVNVLQQVTIFFIPCHESLALLPKTISSTRWVCCWVIAVSRKCVLRETHEKINSEPSILKILNE